MGTFINKEKTAAAFGPFWGRAAAIAAFFYDQFCRKPL